MVTKSGDIEKSILTSAQKGDGAAFEKIVLHYQHRVLALACNIAGNPVDAWDIAQEVFIRLYRYLPGFRFQNRFYTWLYRIVVNTSYDWLKQKQRFRTVTLDSIKETGQPETVHRTLDCFDLQEKIMEGLDRMNHLHKTAFILKEVEGLSCKEIANVMECPPGTVRSHLFHARKGLQAHLRINYPELAQMSKKKDKNDAMLMD